MALDTLYKLDPTSATSNSNFAGANIAENCLPSGINNALRALGQMAAQQICYQGPNISASVSTNIAATTTGLFNPIVHGAAGNPNISSFGVVPGEQPSAAVVRFLQFSCSASLSNGAALRLLGNASRRTQPGDIGGYIHVGSSDVWHEFLWSRATDADGNFTSVSASVAAFTTLSAASASISHITATTISASVINLAGVAVPPRYGFHATTGQTTTISTTAAPIAFGTENFDIGGFFASSIWTPPAGLAHIKVQVEYDSISTSSEFNLCLLENSVTVTRRVETGRGLNVQSSLSIDRLLSTDGTKGYSISAYKSAGSGNDGRIIGGTGSVFFCGVMA